MSASDLAVRRRSAPPRLPLVAGAAALALEIATHLVDYGAWDLSVRLLDSNEEWSYSHILATASLALGAVACGRRASAASPRRGWWLLACALFALLLIDNVARVHEHVPLWPLVYGPFLAGLFLAVARVAAGTDRAGLVYAGVGLLCLSLLIHVLGPPAVEMLGWTSDSWAYQIKVALKEGTELAGWVLLVPALWRLG